MNAKVGEVFFDTCSLWNFAVVNRLDLLEERYGYRAKWTETVKSEVVRASGGEPRLNRILSCAWLDEPIEILAASTADLHRIDQIRRALGGLATEPTKHLGEAELIWYLENAAVGSVLISDDRPAASFARGRGIHVIDSARVLAECFSQGEIGCPDAYNLLVEMEQNEGRGVLVPTDHTYVC